MAMRITRRRLLETGGTVAAAGALPAIVSPRKPANTGDQMRALPLAVLAVTLALPATARQPVTAAPVTLSPAPTLAADSDARWVPFDLTPGNQIAFRMTVNGREATAVLHTGVNFTLASTGFARVDWVGPEGEDRVRVRMFEVSDDGVRAVAAWSLGRDGALASETLPRGRE